MARKPLKPTEKNSTAKLATRAVKRLRNSLRKEKNTKTNKTINWSSGSFPFFQLLFKSGFGGGMKRVNRKQPDAKASGKAEAKEDNTLTGAAVPVTLAPPS